MLTLETLQFWGIYGAYPIPLVLTFLLTVFEAITQTTNPIVSLLIGNQHCELRLLQDFGGFAK